MAQGALPFKYEEEKKTTGMTALGGLPVYLDLAHKIRLTQSIQRHVKVREGGQGLDRRTDSNRADTVKFGRWGLCR